MKGEKAWIKLDNAAKIYPAARTRKWSALFRLSASLTEPVDPAILQAAVARLRKPYPAFFMQLRRGLFWYYLEAAEGIPAVREDGPYPCMPLGKQDGGFCFRVLYYRSRIAVEFFHVLTDGTGGLRFLKTLVAEYLRLKYGICIPRDQEIADCGVPACPEDTEDSFLKYAGAVSHSRRESNAFRIQGAAEPDGFVHLTLGMLSSSLLRQKAKEKGASVTVYLTAVMLLALDDIQQRERPSRRRQRPIKVSVPVNLRQFFPSRTMRNFASYINAGVDPRMGEYTLDELIRCVHHTLGLEATPKRLSAKFTANVRSERNAALRATPLFLKDPVMNLVFLQVGDRKSSTTISNLGLATLPEAMENYVQSVEFILGPLRVNKVACSAISYGDTVYFNITRTIQEPKLEQAFFTRLVRLGIPVRVDSNQKG